MPGEMTSAERHLHGPPEGSVIWLTGLSGAGKTTISRLLAEELRQRELRVEVIDGDVIRQNLARDLGFSRSDRDENVRRTGFVCDLLSRNGVLVIAALISPYRTTRELLRSTLGRRFVEVHVRASIETCTRRDPKGLYRRAMAGEIANFTGVSDPYEEPISPEIALATEQATPEESVGSLIAYLDATGRLGSEPTSGAR